MSHQNTKWNSLHFRQIVVRFPAEAQIRLLSEVTILTREPTKPALQWIPGALPSVINRPELEADHSRTPSTKVKNECKSTQHPHIPSWRVASLRTSTLLLNKLTRNALTSRYLTKDCSNFSHAYMNRHHHTRRSQSSGRDYETRPRIVKDYHYSNWRNTDDSKRCPNTLCILHPLAYWPAELKQKVTSVCLIRAAIYLIKHKNCSFQCQFINMLRPDTQPSALPRM